MRQEPLRDCQAWKDEGLTLSTTSNEASQLYDSCLSQYVGWYDAPETGGLDSTCEKMLEVDSDFAIGKALTFGLSLLSTSDTIRSNQALKSEYEALLQLEEKQKDVLNSRELLHLTAISQWAEGKPSQACRTWEAILLDHPTDMHALKMAHDTYFFLGDLPQIRDSVARVLPQWEATKPPLKSYVYGMYAFGLEETNFYSKAEFFGRKGLEENPYDGWSTHSLAHVFEMEGRTHEGLKFMSSTKPQWEKANLLASHNHWHTALYHVENGDFLQAAEVLEKELIPRVEKSQGSLDLVDCSSLLWRLGILQDFQSKENQEAKNVLKNIAKPHLAKHVSTFNDAHFMMTVLSGDEGFEELSHSLLDSYESESETSKYPVGELRDHPTLGGRILQALTHFRRKKWAQVVDLLEPISGQVLSSIGGSNAQRDVFNLTLIVAALKSSRPRDKKLARALIAQRENLKGKSTNLLDRFKASVDYNI